MLKLASKTYWQRVATAHGYDIKKGLTEADEITIAHAWLNSKIINIESDNVFGMGIFKENEGYVLNSAYGRFVNVKGEIFSTPQMKPLGGNVYKDIIKHELERELTTFKLEKADLDKLTDEWKKFYNVNPSILYGILGWGIQAALARISSFRSHLWITGGTGVGKSFMLQSTLGPLFKGINNPKSDPTAASIRQELTDKNNVISSPILSIDEAGGENDGRRDRMKEIIQDCKHAASGDEHTTGGRGTKDHESRSFSSIFAMVLASVDHILKDPQEVSRFAILDFDTPTSPLGPEFFTKYEGIVEELNPKFIHLLLKEAGNYTKLHEDVTNELLKRVKSESWDWKSHFLRSVSAITTGYALILQSFGDKDAAISAIKALTPFIGMITNSII